MQKTVDTMHNSDIGADRVFTLKNRKKEPLPAPFPAKCGWAQFSSSLFFGRRILMVKVRSWKRITMLPPYFLTT